MVYVPDQRGKEALSLFCLTRAAMFSIPIDLTSIEPGETIEAYRFDVDTDHGETSAGIRS